MRHLITAIALAVTATTGLAAQIDPGTTQFPWKNGPAHDARYILTDHPNTVHIFEAYSINCSWCNKNADQVQALANEYAGDSRVQFIDLGLDSRDTDFQRWITAHKPTYPVVQDVNKTVWNALKQENGIPQTFVVDCKGNMTDFTIGYWGDAEIQTIKDAIARAKEVTCE